jgi:hypothetical protein
MPGLEPKRELIQIRISSQQKRSIETAARHRGLSMSELLRQGADALITQVGSLMSAAIHTHAHEPLLAA